MREAKGERRRARIASGHAALEKAIYELLSERFEESAILGVRIKDDVDVDGDRVLRIMIVLAGGRSFDGKQMVGFVRHLRSRMSGNAFPIVSFVSKEDADKLTGEAA